MYPPFTPQHTVLGSRLSQAPVTVAVKYGDVDGDHVIDRVLLTGTKTPDSPLWQNITLLVQNGRTHQYQQIAMKNNMGYNPTLFLGDLTGNRVDDILVEIDTGGSGGGIYAYVFSNINGQIRPIFDSESFNEAYSYHVSYENQYKVQVTSSRLRKKFILDLHYKGKEYLSEIYRPNGTLKEPVEGWVNPASGLYPIDFNRDGSYELQAVQAIAGRYNADRLGYIQTTLKWNGRGFAPQDQNVAILGGNL